MKALKFYDMKKHKSFTSDKYKLVTRSKRHFATAVGPSGNVCWRIVAKTVK